MTLIKSILLISALLFLGCANDDNSEVQGEATKNNDSIYVSKSQFENAQMKLGHLLEKDFELSIHVNGVIDVPPQNVAEISAYSGGYIKNLPLLIGEQVKKGEVLVTLENPEFIHMQQTYLEISQQVAYLKSEYERQKTMLEENITSQKSFLKAESEYRTAMARSSGLKKNLEMLNIDPVSVMKGNIVSVVNIYSPIDGFITEIAVNTGTYVSPADKVMKIINTNHIHLELNVFEKDLHWIKKGQEINFRVPEVSKEYFNGEVHLVGTTIDTKSRIGLVHGHIDEEQEADFTTGMFVEADIITSSDTRLALPEEAVVELEGRNYVLVLESEDADTYTLSPLEVKLESRNNGFVSIQSPLPLNKRFLIKGGFALLQE